MKLKIIEKGWETYTGPLRGGMFVNGVCEDISPDHARQLANYIRVETDEGKNPSSSQAIIDAQDTPAFSPTYQNAEESGNLSGTMKPASKQYTQAELEAVADAKGIDGLREIATPMNVKGTSIVKLITTILEVQKQAGQPKA